MPKAEGKKKKPAKEKPADLSALFDALSGLGPEEYDKRLATCNQILQISPTDADALQVKVVNLLQLSRNEEAEKLIVTANLQKALAFEYAYALYCLNKTDQAREVLAAVPETQDNRESLVHLRAQICQKEEDRSSAARLYREILETAMEEDPEVMCNLLACSTVVDERTSQQAMQVAKQHWETCFNLACTLVEAEKWKEAGALLQECQALCEAAARELEWPAQQLQDELCVIQAQQAFVLRQLGDVAGSRALIDSVLAAKPSSIQATAVAEINWVALNKDQGLFEACKKLRHVSRRAVNSKLTAPQRMAVRHSNAALLLRMGKVDACHSACGTLTQQCPASDLGPLFAAALYAKEKKFGKAEDALRTYIKAHSGSALPLRAQLSLAQLQLSQRKTAAAIQTLSQIHGVEQRLGILAFLVKLYVQTRQVEAAIKLLDSAIDFLSQQPPSQATQAKVLTLLTKSAELKLQERRYQEAADTYKRGLQVKANDTALLSGLVVALAEFNPDEAEQCMTKLPRAVDEGRLQALLADRVALEAMEVPRDGKATKKRKASGDNAMEVDRPQKGRKTSARKKKRKMRHPPKVIDGKPDPERWIRLKDRSYYKKPSKKHKDKGKKDGKKR
eukprot:GGOE01043022.1.p1 GENE.GGOE01043022.1~~GGOE01043022.1.p1  ORF type:complete len:620 (-),score=245.71 GGOE01043022.1:272-2131(-)